MGLMPLFRRSHPYVCIDAKTCRVVKRTNFDRHEMRIAVGAREEMYSTIRTEVRTTTRGRRSKNLWLTLQQDKTIPLEHPCQVRASPRDILAITTMARDAA